MGIATIRLLATCALLLAGVTASANSPEPATRAIGGFQTERGENDRRRHAALRDYAPSAAKRPGKTPRKPGQQKTSPCCEFRIYEASTALFDDFDGDGYYTYLRVNFDVDTDYSVADVYADVYLVDSGGGFTRIYESDIFTIYGSSGTDDYEIEAELVAGFPPDDYDVLIEVYDAYDDRLVVEYGAWESSALSLLPLEDISFDTLTPVVHAHGGGGSVSWAGVLALLLLWRGARGSRAGRRQRP